MRLYDGRSVNRFLDRRFKSHAPGRDAIVWDYDDANMTVRCKIQGSNEYIVCHYPRNFRTKEEWCKRGNAVRIEHKGGVRGYLEVVGHGRAIPSPVSGPAFPTAETLADIVIVQGDITPFSGMTVEIDATSYRIDGLNYVLNTGTGYLIMGVDDPGSMGTPGALPMGASNNQYVTFSAAPAEGYWRYDLVVAGTDGLVNVVTGDSTNSNTAGPTMPTLPADHVRLFHVLIIGGMTVIGTEHINMNWEPRVFHAITLAITGTYITGGGAYDSQFAWGAGLHPYCTVTITARDQYGWGLPASMTAAARYDFAVTQALGTGYLNSSESSLQLAVTGSGYSTAFTYYRDQSELAEPPEDTVSPEISPILTIIESNLNIGTTAWIALFQYNGDPIA